MPLVPDQPPQFSLDDIEKIEAQKRGERLLAYLDRVDLSGPPPAYYEGTRAGNLKYIIEDARGSIVQTPLQQIETDAKEI